MRARLLDSPHLLRRRNLPSDKFNTYASPNAYILFFLPVKSMVTPGQQLLSICDKELERVLYCTCYFRRPQLLNVLNAPRRQPSCAG